MKKKLVVYVGILAILAGCHPYHLVYRDLTGHRDSMAYDRDFSECESGSLRERHDPFHDGDQQVNSAAFRRCMHGRGWWLGKTKWAPALTAEQFKSLTFTDSTDQSRGAAELAADRTECLQQIPPEKAKYHYGALRNCLAAHGWTADN